MRSRNWAIQSRYEKEKGGKIDVFIYDSGIKGIQPGTKDERVLKTFRNSEEDLEAIRKKGGIYTNVEYDQKGLEEIQKLVKGKFLVGRYKIAYDKKLAGQDGVVMDSLTLVTGLKGRFFKVRVSSDLDNKADLGVAARVAETIYDTFPKK